MLLFCVSIADIQYYQGENKSFQYEGRGKPKACQKIIGRFLLRREASVQNLVEHLTHRVHKLVLSVHLSLMFFIHNAGLQIAVLSGEKSC